MSINDIKKITLSVAAVNGSTPKNKTLRGARKKSGDGSSNAGKIKLALINRIKQHKLAENSVRIPTPSLLESNNVSEPNYSGGSGDEFSKAFEYMGELSKRSDSAHKMTGNVGGAEPLSDLDFSSNMFSQQQTSKSNNSSSINTSLGLSTNKPEYSIDTEIPYGCLRGGKKPVYRTWNHTMKRDNGEKISALTPPPIMLPPDPKLNDEERMRNIARDNKLRNLQNKIAQLNAPAPNPTWINSSITGGNSGNSESVCKRKTIRRKLVLGKSDKTRTISVLIKDNATRRKVTDAEKELQSAKMGDVKKYLYRHGFVKNGSTAPPRVLREIYESATMTGNVFNHDKELLLHNCMTEDIDN